MSIDLLIIAVLAGAANWAFRYLPMRFPISGDHAGGILTRLLAASGPAAICTLFVASLLPTLSALPKDGTALLAGVGAVCIIFVVSQSVAAATFAGASAYALAVWALGSMA